MAGIDKTYCSSWEKYQEIVNWAKEHEFTCPNGMIIKPFDSIFEYNQEDFDGDEIPIMGTTWALDYFLIKFCPIKLIQDRMKAVYSQEYLESVWNGNSYFDTFVRPEAGTKVKLIKNKNHSKRLLKCRSPYSNKNIRFPGFVSVYRDDDQLFYNEDYDAFIFPYELGDYTGAFVHIKCKSIKAIIRRIRKWNLPKGCTVEVCGQYDEEEWTFKTL